MCLNKYLSGHKCLESLTDEVNAAEVWRPLPTER